MTETLVSAEEWSQGLAPGVQISVRDLKIALALRGEPERLLVKGISFDIRHGETLCLVGESGCGKSVTSLALMGLLSPPLRLAGGHVLLREGEKVVDLATLPARGKRYRDIRGRLMSMIFQEPMTSLNPVHTNGAQIAEVIRQHTGASRAEARKRMLDLMTLVGIPSPEIRAKQYPHQLSGGMRQRIMIAMALACEPGFLIADEPTTALDVTIQAQILQQIRRLARERDTATLFITHDLGVVAQLADTVQVMYLGEVVERGSAQDVFKRPAHPYTQGLLASIPSLAPGRTGLKDVEPIPGTVRDIPQNPCACPFQLRCRSSQPRCADSMPPRIALSASHTVRCWLQEPGNA